MAETASSAPPRRLPLGLCLGFGVGTNGSATLMGVTGIYLLFYMTTVLGISPAVAGALIFLSKAYDLVTDPLMGYISDRTETRIGRRRPYLVAGAIVSGLSLYLLFSVPMMESRSLLLGYYALLLLIFATGYTLFTVPYLSMPAEMTNDYHERTRLMSFRTLFGSTGLLIGTAVAPILVSVGSAVSGGSGAEVFEVIRPADGALDCILNTAVESRRTGTPEGYRFMAAILGGVVFLSMLLSFWSTKSAHFTLRNNKQGHFLAGVVSTLKNRPFRLLVATKTLQLTGVTSFSTSLAFFAQFVVQMSGAQLGMFFGLFSLGTILSLPAWVKFAGRAGKKTAYFTAVLMFAAFDLSLLGAMQAGLNLVLTVGFLIGLSAGGLIMLGVSMLPDTIEYDYHLTGQKREGVYAGVWSTIEKGSAAIATLLTGIILSLAGFIETTVGQTACQPLSAVSAVVFNVALLPAGLMLLSLLILSRYDLTREKLEAFAEKPLERPEGA
jgi:GPH family glycoside/pentoside/hexuronide:cation symporter